MTSDEVIKCGKQRVNDKKWVWGGNLQHRLRLDKLWL